jgi:phospholipid/cholesterol/gamma-HCH transport system ATP-binding protein
MFDFLRKRKVSQDSTAASAASDPVHIRIKGLHKAFGENKEHKVLTGVDLNLYRAKINVIIGGSGCGKSILLKHVIAIVEPDAGEILIDGVNIIGKNDFELQPIRKQFGMLFQYSALFDSMSIFDNIAFPIREHTKFSEKEIKERIFELLNYLKLEKAAYQFPAELSGGMRKRAGLARALALNPKIIIFDEPTTGLDPVLTKEVDSLIVETLHREKMTGIMITHDMASTFRIGDYVSMLHQGKIVAFGTPQEMMENKHPLLQEFIELSGVRPHNQFKDLPKEQELSRRV